MTNDSISRRFTTKIIVAVGAIMVLAGLSYVMITIYFTNNYFLEASQLLNRNVANHVIQEKFQEASPFLEDGTPNKPLFGDLMHDMMAVNRSIEVYLLNPEGYILYSIVLDHSDEEKPLERVDLGPIEKFISSNGDQYILGDDPRNRDKQNIFSAAHFSIDGNEGYIYIILAGQAYESVNRSLIASYFFRLGGGATLLTIVISILLGAISILALTRNLREIITQVKRFKEGDYQARISDPESSDMSTLAVTFNEMAETISNNIEELKSVEKLRKELTANVSHDLRTPLAIMKGYIETMQIKDDKLTSEERENYLAIVSKSLEKLTKLVTQLFEFSKLEAQQIEPECEPFHIGELAADVKRKYKIIADQEKVSLEVEIAPDTPLVFADISLVERAIQNLIDNALRYTPEGGHVAIMAQTTNKAVEISIKDTGPGIPIEDQSFIFERYKKSGTSRREDQGAGLGLAIVKKIMEIHSTTIKVISLPEKGTTFQFSLPAYAG
ncbi:MAG: HAMP domain-containing sensor histidine kinase [Cyclobacteriaceae bacterium]